MTASSDPAMSTYRSRSFPWNDNRSKKERAVEPEMIKPVRRCMSRKEARSDSSNHGCSTLDKL